LPISSAPSENEGIHEAPDGSKDENVFDIEQGVAISLFIKHPDSPRAVFHSELWGSRQDKYVATARGEFDAQSWTKLKPDSPNYFFIPQEVHGRTEYEKFKSVADIFIENVTGIVTARDNLVVGFEESELRARFREFSDLAISDEEIRRRYKVGDNYQWKMHSVRKALESEAFQRALVQSYTYRPFDQRKLYNDPRLVFRPRQAVMRHFNEPNIGLITTRITKDKDTVFCTAHAIAHKSASAYDISYVFPLHLIADVTRRENLSPDFRAFIDSRYEHHYTPEEVLGYIYAVLHAPVYRARYAEFLRIDFPRVPFPEAADDFETLSSLGWALVQTHLLRELPRRGLAAYHGKGDHRVEGVRYSPQEQAIHINKAQHFKPVPQAVWEFHIGGYQVLNKYLKSRKGRVLSLDEINHIGAIAHSLAFTIEQMTAIDAAYRAAFPDQA